MEANKNLIGPLADIKLAELIKLGAASKQLARTQKNKKLSRRCHIAMAYIVNDIWAIKDVVLKKRPDIKDLLNALILLHIDCENGRADNYINKG